MSGVRRDEFDGARRRGPESRSVSAVASEVRNWRPAPPVRAPSGGGEPAPIQYRAAVAPKGVHLVARDNPRG